MTVPIEYLPSFGKRSVQNTNVPTNTNMHHRIIVGFGISYSLKFEPAENRAITHNVPMLRPAIVTCFGLKVTPAKLPVPGSAIVNPLWTKNPSNNVDRI